MKLLLTLLFTCIISIGYTQQMRIINLDTLHSKPKTEQQLIGKALDTKSEAIYGGVKYHIYQTARGKYFIIVKSRNGNYYKKYIEY